MYNRLRVSVIRRVYIWFLYVSVCERGEQRINKYMSGATSIPNYLLFELFCVCLRCSSSTESGCLFCTHTHTHWQSVGPSRHKHQEAKAE
jgi:hypothetical protein